MFSPATPVIKIDDPSTTSGQYNGDINASLLSSSPLLQFTPASMMGNSVTNNMGGFPAFTSSSLGVMGAGNWGFRGEDAGSDAGSEFDNSDVGSEHGSTGSPHVGTPNINIPVPGFGVHLAPPTSRFKRKTSMASVGSLGGESDISDDGYLSAGSISNYSIYQMSSPMIHSIPSPNQSPNPSPELSPSLHAFLFSELIQNPPLVQQMPMSSPNNLGVLNSFDDQQFQAMLSDVSAGLTGIVDLNLNTLGGSINFPGAIDLDPLSLGQPLPHFGAGSLGMQQGLGAMDSLINQQRSGLNGSLDPFAATSYLQPATQTQNSIPSSVEAQTALFSNPSNVYGSLHSSANSSLSSISTTGAATVASHGFHHPDFPTGMSGDQPVPLHNNLLSPAIGYPSAPSPSGSDFSAGGDENPGRSPNINLYVENDFGDDQAHPTTASAAAALATANAHAAAAANGASGTSRRPTLYQCPFPECAKTFTRPYNLKSHYRSHTGERPYHCPFCTHTFPRKHDLKRHEKLHGGGKPFTCPGCNKAFARADALKRHVKSTDPNRETVCSQKIRALKEQKELEAKMGISSIDSVTRFEDRVVLDIGSQYIKCGLSGEHKPRHIIPFTLPIPHAGSQEFAKSGNKYTSLYQLSMDPALDEMRKKLLTYHLQAVYNKYLLTDPKQRKVIICESPMLPVRLKNIIVGILFELLQVPSITFIQSGLLALMTAGKMTGLVIDSGHLETTAVPFYEGRPLIHMTRTIPKAGQSVTKRLKLLIRNHGTLVPENPSATQVPITEHLVEAQPLELWEDAKARFCLVGKFPSIADVSGDNREASYPYRERAIPYTIFRSDAEPVVWRLTTGERVNVPGWVRERAAEILFEGDDDGESVASIALDAIMRCPIDIRSEMIENIVLAGGTAMLPGFQPRLMEHMQHLLENSANSEYSKIKRLSIKVKFVKTVFMPNCLSWVGGSLVGAIKNGGVEVLREPYLRDRVVPDWTTYVTKEEIEAEEAMTY
ncbi:hypothetical protein HDU67_000125 [Dinochytrium kinnereticum]|nr:hypothetical protein HDU67_000125 [Dinochytrium kinnereticum]